MSPVPSLAARLEILGRQFGAREAEHGEALEQARACADRLRGAVSEAVDRFHAGADEAGASHLRIQVSEIRVDDKHVRAVEFDLLRGRHKAVVIAKARGEVTLVGPFHAGKSEGPCRTFPMDAADALDDALEPFLVAFIEEALTP